MSLEITVKKALVCKRVNILLKLMNRHGRICWYCGDKFTSFNEIEIDHIVPKERGGTNHINNLAIACLKCNRAKLDYNLEEFLHWLRKPKVTSSYIIELSRYPEEQIANFGNQIYKGLRKLG